MKRKLFFLLLILVHFCGNPKAGPLVNGKGNLNPETPPSADAFVFTWQTALNNESVLIPINPFYKTLYDYSVDWGDGNQSSHLTGDAPHIYSAPGKYTVSITGNFPAIMFGSSTSDAQNDKRLLTIDQWGTQVWSGMASAFAGCSSLTRVPNAPGPILKDKSTLYSMFFQCSGLRGDLDKWDVSMVRETSFMFYGASMFNGNISNWDVSNVTNMGSMFQGASLFNQNLNSWDVSKVTIMDDMFNNTLAFNGDISNWDVSVVSNMNAMFANARVFNVDIGGWNVGKVTTMNGMFNGASIFNQDIGDWDVSKVISFMRIFCNAKLFNQDLGSWDVHSATDMSLMFGYASRFNGNIGGWDVSNVEKMNSMFVNAYSFNQDISKWNVSKVNNMRAMFYSASAFNQHLGSWNINSVDDMGDMFTACGLSSVNYETTLQGWSAESPKSGVQLGATDLKYCSSKGRDILTSTYGWDIEGDVQACGVVAHPDPVGIVYVDSSNTAPGDGSSWANALQYLSDAVVSAAGDNTIKEIHIAKGTYYPTGSQNADNRDSCFMIKRPGLKILGGYPMGGGTRNAMEYPTILSGDINVSGDTIDNSYHVMQVRHIAAGTDSLIIDGVTFTEGNANQMGDISGGFTAGYTIGAYVGGGLVVLDVAANTVIRNCSIYNNYGLYGAGMVVMGSVPYIQEPGSTDPTITIATPQISDCLFKSNVSITSDNSIITFSLFGGGLANMFASPVIRNCDFVENKSLAGGAMLNGNTSAPVIINTRFKDNTANGGSVLFNSVGGNATLINCSLTGNYNTGFEGMDETLFTPEIVEMLENAFIINMQEASCRLINTTVTGNYSTIDPAPSGPGIITLMESSSYVTNSILWNNQSSAIIDGDQSGNISISNSLIQGLPADALNQNLDGTLGYDYFVDTAKGDYRLNVASPAIDAGRNDSLLLAIAPYLETGENLDLAGNPRIYTNAGAQTGTVDLGAFETQRSRVAVDGSGILHVNAAAAPGGDAKGWSTALNAFDTALMAGRIINYNADIAQIDADSVRQIWLAGGTYMPVVDSAFTMLPNVKIYGSFSGDESALAQRSYGSSYTSILSGNGNSVLRNDNNGLDTNAVLDGFVVTNGGSMGKDEGRNGGGIYNRNVSPFFSHLLITGNAADYGGGGVANIQSYAIFNNVQISDNTATHSGGGIYNRDGSGILLYNTLVSGNSAIYGGGIFNSNSYPQLTNVTVSGNTASGHGGGISSGSSTVEMTNSILWANLGQDLGNDLYNENSTANLSYSLYSENDKDLFNNNSVMFLDHLQAVDPQFVDAAEGNYQLSHGSVAIDAGNNTPIAVWDSIDLLGNSRIINGKVDMGAFEYIGDPLAVKMSDLQGRIDNQGHALLSWTTFSETENKGFQVQQSKDGLHFTEADLVTSLAPEGSSQNTLHYHHDAGVISVKTYFRLRQTDRNGKISYSNIILLQPVQIKAQLRVYPNPAISSIHVYYTGKIAGNATIQLLDPTGRLLRNQHVSGADSRVDLSGLAAGIYFIKYVDEKKREVVRIIKQK